MKRKSITAFTVLILAVAMLLTACGGNAIFPTGIVLMDPPADFEIPSAYQSIMFTPNSLGIVVDGEGMPRVIQPDFSIFVVQDADRTVRYAAYGEKHGIGGKPIAAGLYEVAIKGDVEADGSISVKVKRTGRAPIDVSDLPAELSGGGSPGGTPLFEYLNNPAIHALDANFETDFPVSVSVLYQNVGGGSPYTVTDEATIRAVFAALKNLSVTGEGGFAHTDDYLTYYFTMADGGSMQFTFQSGCYIGHNETLLSLEGFRALTEALSYPPDWQPPEEIRPLYTNERLGFEIELFEGWEATETNESTVEIIPPEKLQKETTTNLIIERIEGRTAEDMAAEAKAQSRFGTLVEKAKNGYVYNTYLYINGPYTGVSLRWEKPGEAGTVLWTEAQFVNGGNGNSYLIYYTTIHDARYDSRLSWFGTYAGSVAYTFRLPELELEYESGAGSRSTEEKAALLEERLKLVQPLLYPGSFPDDFFESTSDKIEYKCNADFGKVAAWYEGCLPRLFEEGDASVEKDKTWRRYSGTYEGNKLIIILIGRESRSETSISILF
ncbi:MAG: hypothetical protein LBN26_03150 [Christensenellaceae bacterium]|jgi:hypothetical protein|nr:hypothetical protein [Christensenellaceae bacterium]